MDNLFWQANFWGIVGTTTGIFGFFISLLNWRYSKPKIKIAKLYLETTSPKRISEWYLNKTEEQLRGHLLHFKLHVILKNKGGGNGSIEKPFLLVSVPQNYNRIFKGCKKIVLKPQVRDSGVAWNLTGGETQNDEVEYYIWGQSNARDLISAAKNYEQLKYAIEYKDNFGYKYCRKIKEIIYE